MPLSEIEWKRKYPGHCTDCMGWGGSWFEESHGLTYGLKERLWDPCENPEFQDKCHRCGSTVADDEDECPECGWKMEGGEGGCPEDLDCDPGWPEI